MNISNNLLLYGPPGTGKTYNTVNYAVSIVENRPLEDIIAEGYPLALEKYDRYTKMGRIAFMTFHQSLSYDDFIEGIRPEVNDDGSLIYVPTPGVFYNFCRKADHPVMLEGSIPKALEGISDLNRIYAIEIEDREGACVSGTVPVESLPEGVVDGDVLIVLCGDSKADLIGIVEEAQSYRVNWYALESPVSVPSGTAPYRIIQPSKKFVFNLVNNGEHKDEGNCVFIIDEINRGNISRIFGELITLLESSRRRGRPECLEVYLAQMKVMFSVPDNVYVLGTMNTADRSLTALDTALRRRFEFIEMMPDPNVLLGRKVADINLSRLLATINNRIEILYDREHMMGHAYFIGVRTLEDLAQCFINKVIPLLQEYFFDDYEKICWVLGRANDPRKCDFIAPRKRNSFQIKFNLPDVYDIVTDHRVFMNPETYIQIYKGADI